MRPAVRACARIARPAATAARAIQRGPRLTILGWHRIDTRSGWLTTRLDVFRRQLDVLLESGAAVLPLTRATRLLVTGELPERAVVLTFDDGYASVLETAWPILREHRLPATLFVVTGYLDGRRRCPWDADAQDADVTRVADADTIRAAVESGLDVGSHTITHPWLPHLTATALSRELIESRAAVEQLCGRPVTSAAYPMGGWNKAVRDAAARAGYAVGITVDRGRNSATQNPLAMRRAFAPDSVEDFRLMLDGAYTWLRPVDTWRTRNGPR